MAGGDSRAARVRVETLGRFAVEVEGAPLRFGRRGQRRPLELLKTLIACGGVNVPRERLADALWPAAEGDAAQTSFGITLHRLRQLIGSESLLLRNGALSLDPAQCWVDAIAFQHGTERAHAALAERHPASALTALEAALALYHGPFLAGEFDPEELPSTRERLHGTFLQLVRELARLHRERGDLDAAIAAYQRGLAVDEIAEDLYAGLLDACLTAGRFAEGIAAYRRCEAVLRDTLHTEPSARLRDACDRLRAGAVSESPPVTGPDVHELRAGETPPLPDDPSVAVLPFDNLTGDPEQTYFSDGLADSIITALARIPALRVVARNSSFAYKGQSMDVRRMGRELGVAHVLEGSVLRSGARMRVTAQLIDARSGHHVWAAAYDRKLSDMLAVMDDITRNVVTELGSSLVYGDNFRYSAASTGDAAAFDKFLQAAHQYHLFEPQSNVATRRLLTEAIELDPTFSRAMAVLGYTHLHDCLFGWSRDPDASVREAEAWARRSLEADPQCVVGMQLMSRILTIRRQYDDAIALGERAIATEPGNANVHADHALTLLLAGHFEQALTIVQQALRLGPLPTMIGVFVAGEANFLLGRHEEARRHYELLMERTAAPGQHASNARRKLIAIHMAAGREAEARALAAQHLEQYPDFSLARHREVHLRWPHRDYAWFDGYLDALRRAGLPD